MTQPADSTNYLERAQKLIEVNRFSEAIPVLTKAITEAPQDYDAMCNLSFCFCQLEENNKCLEYAEKAIAIDPASEWAYRLKSIMLARKGHRKASLEFAQKAVSVEPDNELAVGNLVYAYLNTDRLVEAREIAEQRLELSPDSEESHYLFGLVEKSFQNYPEAEKWFRQALEIAPNFAEARNMLAFTILKQSDRGETQEIQELETRGLEHMLESVKIDPNNQRVIENIKSQFDNSLFYFSMIYLTPFVVFGLLVTPIVTVLAGLFMFGILVHLIRQNNRRFEKLSPELKNLLKVRNYAYFLGEKTARFFYGGFEFLKMLWIQYLIALAIFLCSVFSPFGTELDNFYFIIKILFWGNLFWIFNRITKFADPPKQS